MKRLIISGILAALFLLLLPIIIRWIEISGSVIHHGDIFSDYYAGFVLSLFLGASILVWPIPSSHRVPLIVIWLVKMLVVLGAMLVYEYKYGQIGLDAFHYFDESTKGLFRWSSFEHGAGTTNMINLTRLYQLIMPDSYHAMKSVWAFVGLIAVYLIYLAATKAVSWNDRRLLYAIAFFPSILFWSSILGKDPINLFAISLYVLGTVGWLVENRLGYIVLIVIGVFIASYIRIWYGPIMTIPLVLTLFFYPTNLHIKVPLFALVIVGLIASFGFFSTKMNFENLAELIAVSDTISQSWADRGGSGQVIEGGLGSLGATIKFLPIGAFSALFRPLPGEVMNMFGLLAGLESLVLVILLGMAIKRTSLQEIKKPVLIWALSFIVVWSLFYGIASYQNLGSAVRFRLQILPVLFLVLLFLARKRT